MNIRTNNSQHGAADTGLLFAAGVFFLTLALAVAYFSYAGLAPLPNTNAAIEAENSPNLDVPAAAALAISDSASVNLENEKFFAALSQVAVKEIFIGSYGAVDGEVLGFLREEIEKTFGVKTTLLNPGAPIPKESPFYDAGRKQYNSDTLLESVKLSSAQYGASVRFLYVVDANMSSFSEKTSAPWVRAENGANASLLSLYGLGEGSDSFLPRIKKAALYALGTTVGFGLSPSVSDTSCVMYSASSVRELDNQRDAFCSPEADILDRVFVK